MVNFELVNSPTHESKERITTPSLTELYKTVTFNPNRALSDRVTEIDLGHFVKETETLIERSIQDPLHREVGRLVYVLSLNKKVVMGSTDTVGEEARVETQGRIRMNITANIFDKEKRQDRHVAANMHSHGLSDLPPSPTDIIGLLASDLEFAALTSVFVVTPKQSMLMFRGPQTPMLTQQESAEKMDKLTLALRKRVQSHMYHAQSYAEADDINRRANYALIRDICKYYDLKFFAAPRGQKVATLQHFK